MEQEKAKLVEKATEIRKMPEGADKEQAKQTVMQQAKELEQKEKNAAGGDGAKPDAKQDSANSDKGKPEMEQEKAKLVEKATEIRKMPEGADKEQAKQTVMQQAKQLEQKEMAQQAEDLVKQMPEG